MEARHVSHVVAPTGTSDVETSPRGRVSPSLLRNLAIAMILLQAGWRTVIALKGYYTGDDFVFTSLASTQPLDWSYLMRVHVGHLMPGGFALAWGLDKVAPLSWPAVVLTTTVIQLLASFSVWAMLRTLFGHRVAILIPLALYLFSPLTLDSYTWWAAALNHVPLQLFMALAVLCHVRWVRERSPKWLVGSVGSFVLALCFFEKAVLILPLLFALTAWFLVDGSGWFKGILGTLRRDFLAWGSYVVISVGYIVLYRSLSTFEFDTSPPKTGSLELAQNVIGTTFVPSLLGGPWRWLPLGMPGGAADPPSLAKWISWEIVAALIVVSLLVRKRAGRAWILLGLYLLADVALLSIGRLAWIGPVIGQSSRYVADALVPACIVVGLAFLPLVGERDVYTARARSLLGRFPALRGIALAATALAINLLVLSSAVSTQAYAPIWAGNGATAWVKQAQRSLALADPAHPLLSEPVPTAVLPALFEDYSTTSRLLAPVRNRPEFASYTDVLQRFDEFGNLQPAVVNGIDTVPGPYPNCGYTANANHGAYMPLAVPVYDWSWTLQVRYLAGKATPATVTLGTGSVDVELQEGLHDLFVPVVGGGDMVVLDGIVGDAGVCIDSVTVGLRYAPDGS